MKNIEFFYCATNDNRRLICDIIENENSDLRSL